MEETRPPLDPYRPPTSDLVMGQRAPASWGWKLYFAVLALLLVGLLPELGVAWIQLPDALDFAVAGVGLVGLCGYAWGRAFGMPSFWRGWVVFQPLWDVFIALVASPRGWAQVVPDMEASSVGEELFGLIVVVPLYIALFRYAFRSPDVWRR
jgi:hypothetical protein